eukprot:4624309-Prorocentrum_lima.AAC.1
MTSSLVGSEMCIRDSRWRVRGIERKRKRERGAERYDARQYKSKETYAVSYTHLTLPTICSV